MIEFLFTIESDMRKVIGELKSITNTKWNKYLEELDALGDATWPYVDTDISIWEVISNTKAIPSVDND